MTHLTRLLWDHGFNWWFFAEWLAGKHRRVISCIVRADGGFEILTEPIKLYDINPDAEFKPWRTVDDATVSNV